MSPEVNFQRTSSNLVTVAPKYIYNVTSFTKHFDAKVTSNIT